MILGRTASSADPHQGYMGWQFITPTHFYTYIKIALINLIRFTANAQFGLKKCISMAVNYIQERGPFWGDLQN